MTTPPPDIAEAAAKVDKWLRDQETRVLSADELKRLSPAEKLDYCRRFDQTKQAPWKNPRG